MKIAIGYPPMDSEKGIPLLSQNRQFQRFHNPTYIYPMVPAYAATMLENAGYEVIWLDGIAEKWSYQKWLEEVRKAEPDLIMMETKTPVVKRQWEIINMAKGEGRRAKWVLVGDHVTALPEESFKNSKVDYVLTGGDYDFLLLNLANHLTKGEKLQPGIWYRTNEKIKNKNEKLQSKIENYSNTGKFQLNHDLNKLPFIDRDLTKWRLYAYENGNYKRTPGTYIMAGRDCWHRINGGCSFCSWTTLFPAWRARKPELVIDEIGFLIDSYGVQTVFDDTGTFIIGDQLKKFCGLMIKRGYNKKIDFSCNMRFGACSFNDYKLMKKAGFRMLLFGLESANQETLDKINKNLKVEQITDSCREAKKAGLEPHITIMLGYPWESKEDALETVKLGKNLLRKGYADTLQATLIVPYPGTALFKEAKEKGWLKTLNWDRYDMSEPVLKTKMKDSELKRLVQEIYKVAFDPEFIIRRLINIRSLDDVKFILMAGKKVLGHLRDFQK
ncbi:MAG: B12-binding domain-containing radical SAM protein [Patescibacteria group bacterium]